VREHLQD